ncbi:MAG: YggS family pyridoxal phosphate-dependent enzyme [Calditrichia bacterium]
MMQEIRENLENVLERIAGAAVKSGRKPKDVTLIGVTKTVEPARINAAIEAGLKIIGENRVQEAREKFPEIQPVEKHLIGHLQTNKVKYAVQLFDMIQSVDSYHLAEEIDKRMEKLGGQMPVLLEVNTSGEASKFGCPPDEAIALAEKVAQLPHLRIEGLMTIGLFSDEEKLVRRCFEQLRELSRKISEKGFSNCEMKYLSMGMSSDFEWAILEGSNMVRIGSAIFGARL